MLDLKLRKSGNGWLGLELLTLGGRAMFVAEVSGMILYLYYSAWRVHTGLFSQDYQHLLIIPYGAILVLFFVSLIPPDRCVVPD